MAVEVAVGPKLFTEIKVGPKFTRRPDLCKSSRSTSQQPTQPLRNYIKWVVCPIEAQEEVNVQKQI